MTPEEIEHQLAYFTGSEGLHYSPPFQAIKYTDGIQFVLRECKAYWLLGLIYEGYMSGPDIALDLTFWYLTVRPDQTATLEVRRDTDAPVLFSKEIDYTDFPLKEFKFYLEGGTALLPGEY